MEVEHNGSTYPFKPGQFRQAVVANFLDRKTNSMTLDEEQKARVKEKCLWLEAAVRARNQRDEPGAESPVISEPTA